MGTGSVHCRKIWHKGPSRNGIKATGIHSPFALEQSQPLSFQFIHNMHLKSTALTTVAVATLAAATGQSSSLSNQCNTGDILCCQRVTADTSSVADLLGLLGINVGSVTPLIGVTCSFITTIGIAGNSWYGLDDLYTWERTFWLYDNIALLKAFAVPTTLSVSRKKNWGVVASFAVNKHFFRRRYRFGVHSRQPQPLIPDTKFNSATIYGRCQLGWKEIFDAFVLLLPSRCYIYAEFHSSLACDKITIHMINPTESVFVMHLLRCKVHHTDTYLLLACTSDLCRLYWSGLLRISYTASL